MTWAMASLQQYCQLLFAMLSIWLMVLGRLYLSLFFFALSTFTGGGGLALVPIIMLYHALKKNLNNLLVSLFAVIVIIYIYFVLLEYKTPSYHPSILAALFSLHKLFIFSLGFIGGLAKNLVISVAFGLVLLFFLLDGFRLF